MTEIAEKDPRAAYAAFTKSLIADFRANAGRIAEGPMGGRPLLLLTTTGARSGASRTSPVVYSRDGEDYIVVASKGGAPTNPGWYVNLRANPIVTVEVGGETYKAQATAIEGGPERDRLYAQHAALNPVFLDYPSKTDRVIPVVRLIRNA
jgi:deazaflavin-dependent oxidoreductase (nitroreductase family)